MANTSKMKGGAWAVPTEKTLKAVNRPTVKAKAMPVKKSKAAPKKKSSKGAFDPAKFARAQKSVFGMK